MKTIPTFIQPKCVFAFPLKITIIFMASLLMLYSNCIYADDAGVASILSPMSSCKALSGSEKITIWIVNYGKTALSSIPVAYRIGTGATIYDTLKNSLNAGDSVNFTFATGADLSSRGLYKIKAFTTLPGDSNISDDTATALVFSMRLLPAFTSTGLCQSGVGFTSTTLIDSGALTYKWNFGDGETSTNQNPSHKYGKPGLYNVKLVVETSVGCTDSITHTIKVSSSPVSSFTVFPVCIGTPVSFHNNSTIAYGNIVSTIWSFGDRDSSIITSPVHIYSTTGKYRVELVSTSDSGCTTVFFDTVTGSPLPTALFTASSKNVCSGTGIIFSDSSKGDSITYLWSFGDGSSSTDISPTHVFTKSGKYIIRLTVTSRGGCQAVMMDSITVRPGPIAAFSVFNLCIGDSARFTDISTISDSSALIYSWNFGDTTSLVTTKSPVHLYKRTGMYSVTETVSSNTGCSNSVTQTLLVNPLPSPGFTATQNKPLTVDFKAKDTGKGNTYTWDFDDGTGIDTGSSPAHTFQHQGIYRITLTVTNGTKCFVTFTDSITVTSSGIENALIPEQDLDIYPNPFSGITYISYNLKNPSIVNLAIYNETGKLITTVANGLQYPGQYQYTFNASSDALPGLYLVKLVTDRSSTMKKIMEMK